MSIRLLTVPMMTVKNYNQSLDEPYKCDELAFLPLVPICPGLDRQVGGIPARPNTLAYEYGRQ